MFTAILCGLPATALAFEFGGQLALGRGYPLPDPYNLQHTPALVSLTSCQVCSVCVSGGRIEWVLILEMETQEFFFFFFLNRPFSKLAKLQGQLPHRHKEPGYAAPLHLSAITRLLS